MVAVESQVKAMSENNEETFPRRCKSAPKIGEGLPFKLRDETWPPHRLRLIDDAFGRHAAIPETAFTDGKSNLEKQYRDYVCGLKFNRLSSNHGNGFGVGLYCGPLRENFKRGFDRHNSSIGKAGCGNYLLGMQSDCINLTYDLQNPLKDFLTRKEEIRKEKIPAGPRKHTNPIITDSQVALKALQSTEIRSKVLLQYLQNLKVLGDQNRVSLEWVPRHQGLEGMQE
ncbi:hypothetical protein NQ317_014630 [Molorchus minor]|uniref:Uncharacterized protein n=1 Tax=Molorchus minor TaxID=1323400 RepID=A0ABQ9JPD5_9CUCU|nr:hypothetical protein NQ317_014630 [Molorchus minor]